MLLSFSESIPLLLNPSVRLSLFPKVAAILENPSGSAASSLRRAAIEALPSIEGRETESMRILVELMRTRPADPVPVRSVLGFPRENIPGETATLLTESLLRHLRSLPAKERTSEEALSAADLIRHVSAFLPEESANTVAADLADLSVTVIVIKPLPHRMQFDLAEFSVPAGRPVEIVFENVDIMPHNLLVTSPGALTEVGMLAEEMASRPDAFERQFIPDSSKVLYATRMLQPRQIEKLQFTAPEKPDDYPYVCTFPGHWRTMFGTMRVVEPGIAPPPPVRITDESTVLEVRDFVQAWKTQDLVGVLGALDADRDFENGALLFETLSCSKCHRMNGEGGEIGPDLTEVLDKLASGEMDRAGLLREVVEPSRVVAEEYKTAVIRTSDGRIFTGMVLDEDDRVVRLIPNALEPDQVDEVSKDSIESRRQSSVSPMPEGLVNTASQRDILDLLAYLATSGGLRKMAER